jgi:hypothetical protein
MAGGLTLAIAGAARVRRRLAWVGVLALVALVHVLVTRELASRLVDFDAARAMPERTAVSYVRTIEPAAPPPVAAPVAPAAPKIKAPKAGASAKLVESQGKSGDSTAIAATANSATISIGSWKPLDPTLSNMKHRASAMPKMNSGRCHAGK